MLDKKSFCLSETGNEVIEIRTVDGEMDPAAVVARLLAGLLVEHHHRALVPTFVVCPQVTDFDRRRFDQPYPTLQATTSPYRSFYARRNCRLIAQPANCQKQLRCIVRNDTSKLR